MRIAFFLIPKAETPFVWLHNTMRQALEKMEYHHFTSIPVLDDDGRFCSVLTATDFLWFMKNHPDMCFSDTEQIRLSEITPSRQVQAVHIDDHLQTLLERSLTQTFVPVVDDSGVYIGQVHREDIIKYCMPVIAEEPNN